MLIWPIPLIHREKKAGFLLIWPIPLIHRAKKAGFLLIWPIPLIHRAKKAGFLLIWPIPLIHRAKKAGFLLIWPIPLIHREKHWLLYGRSTFICHVPYQKTSKKRSSLILEWPHTNHVVYIFHSLNNCVHAKEFKLVYIIRLSVCSWLLVVLAASACVVSIGRRQKETAIHKNAQHYGGKSSQEIEWKQAEISHLSYKQYESVNQKLPIEDLDNDFVELCAIRTTITWACTE